MPETDKLSIDAIYFTALQLPPQKQLAYLDEVCEGDEGFRDRVMQLLSARSKVGSFLESPAPELEATILQPVTEKPGTLIGRYKLLQKIGEGGMGVVYMAEQEQPVRRKVALKIIKPGMDSSQVVARFEAERQALAMMDHNNIAKVFEAGTTEGGRPYFVMELVHGVPITDFCDANQLTAEQRLDLFIPVCQAIHHAHQKGIIHRDIKPSNVLVTMYDDKPMPKVIDFGVAKAVQRRLTERTLFTEYGALVGTFEYMSPEQAEMNAFGVDTRSDVFSLGVLLYELLTGTTPLERQRIRGAAYGEIVRLIKEEEAPRPSVRLSTSGELAKVAAARKTEPTKLSSLVQGELDWIVMRCLEKDRTRRYDGASSLAKDVERYLSGDAVEACPPTLSYQLRKFARRHRTQVIVASIVLASLLAGIAGTTFGLIRAESRRREAVRQRQIAQQNEQVAIAATDRETAQRKLAEQAVERTLQVFDSMTSDDVGESMSSQRAISKEQRKLYEIAADYFRDLSQEAGSGEAARVRVADAATKLAEFESWLGSNDKAIAAMQIALKPQARLAEEFPTNPTHQFPLVLSHLRLAHFYSNANDDSHAMQQIQSAQALISQLATPFPETGEHKETWAQIHSALGWELTLLAQYDSAQPELLRALELYRELDRSAPSLAHRKTLMDALGNLGFFRGRSGRGDGLSGDEDGHEGLYSEAASIALELLRADPTDANRRYDAGEWMFHLGVGIGRRNPQQGVQHFLDAQSRLEELVAEYPSNLRIRERLARIHSRVTSPLEALGRFDEALSHVDRALEMYQQLAIAYPTFEHFFGELAVNHRRKGEILLSRSHSPECLQWFDEAIDIASHHVSLSGPYQIHRHYQARAVAYDRLQRFENALSDWDHAFETMIVPERSSYRIRLGRLTTQIQLGAVSIDDAVTQEKQLARGIPGDRFPYLRFYAIAAALSEDRKDELAGKALELLTTMAGAGHFTLSELQSNPDFDSLRGYEAFRVIVAARKEAANAE